LDIEADSHFREDKDMKALLLVAVTGLGLAVALLVFTISAPAAQTAASVTGAPLGPADTYLVT
jgi:hypothetical protein